MYVIVIKSFFNVVIVVQDIFMNQELVFNKCKFVFYLEIINIQSVFIICEVMFVIRFCVLFLKYYKYIFMMKVVVIRDLDIVDVVCKQMFLRCKLLKEDMV